MMMASTGAVILDGRHIWKVCQYGSCWLIVSGCIGVGE
jgi:hypothetical protein